MKKLVNSFCAIFLLVFISNKAFSENVSEIFSNLIPGEGITEASIQINEDDNPDLEILAVRDISSEEFSNLFSQISLHTQEINTSDRLITNLGIGYRQLSDDKSSMIGVNSFIDYDLEGHTRGSVGLELKGATLDLSANSYHKLTNMEVVDGTEEQVLSGYEINLSSQIPYMPWATLNWQNYGWEKEKASVDSEGNKLSFEALLSPTIQFDATADYSDNSGVDDEYTYKLSFIYPPREHKKTLQDGFIASAAFEKGNVEKKLKDKVRRSNNLTVEIQGSVIVTSK
tara:strand:+ start:949 stop:1803 length:855 start_codon:yes stop_codon:yes gene_type:complete